MQALWIAIVVIIVALYGCAMPTAADHNQGGRGGEHAGAVSTGGAQHGRGATSGGMGHGGHGASGNGASTGGLGRK